MGPLKIEARDGTLPFAHREKERESEKLHLSEICQKKPTWLEFENSWGSSWGGGFARRIIPVLAPHRMQALRQLVESFGVVDAPAI